MNLCFSVGTPQNGLNYQGSWFAAKAKCWVWFRGGLNDGSRWVRGRNGIPSALDGVRIEYVDEVPCCVTLGEWLGKSLRIWRSVQRFQSTLNGRWSQGIEMRHFAPAGCLLWNSFHSLVHSFFQQHQFRQMRSSMRSALLQMKHLNYAQECFAN